MLQKKLICCCFSLFLDVKFSNSMCTYCVSRLLFLPFSLVYHSISAFSYFPHFRFLFFSPQNFLTLLVLSPNPVSNLPIKKKSLLHSSKPLPLARARAPSLFRTESPAHHRHLPYLLFSHATRDRLCVCL